MEKHLTCRALEMEMQFEVHDESEEEVTVTIGDHLQRVHGVEFTDALRQEGHGPDPVGRAWSGSGLRETSNRRYFRKKGKVTTALPFFIGASGRG